MNNCPKCGKELIGYSNGESYGFGPGYPYESGYYCPDRCVSFSMLELSRGALEDYGKEKEEEKPRDFKKFRDSIKKKDKFVL